MTRGDPKRLESSARRAGASRPIRTGRGRNREIPSVERTRHPGSRQTGRESATPVSRFSLGERSTRTTAGAASGLKEPRTAWSDRSKRGTLYEPSPHGSRLRLEVRSKRAWEFDLFADSPAAKRSKGPFVVTVTYEYAIEIPGVR